MGTSTGTSGTIHHGFLFMNSSSRMLTPCRAHPARHHVLTFFTFFSKKNHANHTIHRLWTCVQTDHENRPRHANCPAMPCLPPNTGPYPRLGWTHFRQGGPRESSPRGVVFGWVEPRSMSMWLGNPKIGPSRGTMVNIANGNQLNGEWYCHVLSVSDHNSEPWPLTSQKPFTMQLSLSRTAGVTAAIIH